MLPSTDLFRYSNSVSCPLLILNYFFVLVDKGLPRRSFFKIGRRRCKLLPCSVWMFAMKRLKNNSLSAEGAVFRLNTPIISTHVRFALRGKLRLRPVHLYPQPQERTTPAHGEAVEAMPLFFVARSVCLPATALPKNNGITSSLPAQ
jgi:hypothetical protein